MACSTVLLLSYDPFGQLSQISLGGAATRFLYSGGQLVGEYNASGGLIRRHIPGASFDETLASLDGSGRTYILLCSGRADGAGLSQRRGRCGAL